jgi:c-di-GMP-binding flagellar brake protein YcgR
VSKLNIEINMKLDVIDLEDRTYMARVEIVKEECMIVKMIVGDREKPKLAENSTIEILVFDNGMIYSAECTVIGIKEDKLFCIAILTIPEDFKKVERRRYFRFPTNIEVEYVIVPKEEEYNQIEDIHQELLKAMKVTKAIDLSGGGIKIFTEETTETNQQVVVSVFIPHEIKVICSVVRVEIDIEDKRYKTSLKFENISERNRDKIIEYIFELVR